MKLTSSDPSSAGQKPATWKSAEEVRHQAERRGVDDEQEEPERQDGDRQGQHHEDRAHDRVDHAEQNGGAGEGAGAVDA